MANETATLAAYVADLKFADIPPEVLERAKVLTLDFLGSAIRARRDAESTPSLLKMLEALALDGKGESTVFGDTQDLDAGGRGAAQRRARPFPRFRRHPCGLLAASERARGAGGVRGRRDGRRIGPRRADRDRGRL